jgi:hypothetical protein
MAGRSALVGITLAAAALLGTAPTEAQDLEARVWLDRGQEPVLHRGDRARLYYRTNYDAYVAVFRLDTNGQTRLVYPRSPRDAHFIRGGRDYRLTFPSSSWWHVDDDPGVGYYFAIASDRPFDFGSFTYAAYNEYGAYGWDLGDIYRTVYHDPYVAMDDLVAALVPDWRFSPYAIDFATYHVGQRYDFPRFLCYECHGYRSFTTWNPYLVSCTNFRVVIYNDPYYYPAYRYRGRRVVYVRPPVYRQPRYIFKERAYGEAPQPITTARPAVPVTSPTVPPPVGRGLDGRVRRADPRTASTPQYGEPLRAPGATPRRAVPSVQAPSTRSGAPTGARPSDGTRPAVPSLGTRPNGATAGPAGRGNTGSVAPPGTRPTRILPGRENADDIGLRRRGTEGSGSVTPTRPGTGTTRVLPPGRVTPPSSSAGPRTGTASGSSRPPAQVRPPSRVSPPSGSRPPTQARPPTQVRPPTRVTPPSRPPARVGPPVRPPTTGSARPPTTGSSRPPVRPTRPGGGGAPPRTGTGGGGPF